jgi:hypothetical protein
VAGFLSDHEPGDLLDQVRQFARRRPGAFLLGAALVGIIAGRLTRGAASASDSSTGGPTGLTSQGTPTTRGRLTSRDASSDTPIAAAAASTIGTQGSETSQLESDAISEPFDRQPYATPSSKMSGQRPDDPLLPGQDRR